MRWEAITTSEFSGLDRKLPVLINIAAIEQHGPHLPVDVDARIGQYFVDEMDRRLGTGMLSLPQIRVCCSEHHMDFAGTLTVRHESFLAYAFDLLSSVIRHGFRNIVILNSHGGNQAIGQVLAEKLGLAHRDARVVFMTWWRIAAERLAEIRESPFGGVNHACEFETALMRHIDPATVRDEHVGGFNHVLPPFWADGDMLEGRGVSLFRTMKMSSGGTGVVGDPSLGTAEKGARIADAVSAKLEEILKDIAS
ncbi:creatininase family protein [Paraburkholderia aspalathi]|nr:creatininase family protein [Paraburkholderia aspalathi]